MKKINYLITVLILGSVFVGCKNKYNTLQYDRDIFGKESMRFYLKGSIDAHSIHYGWSGYNEAVDFALDYIDAGYNVYNSNLTASELKVVITPTVKATRRDSSATWYVKKLKSYMYE